MHCYLQMLTDDHCCMFSDQSVIEGGVIEGRMMIAFDCQHVFQNH